jgi:hypothetical protein
VGVLGASSPCGEPASRRGEIASFLRHLATQRDGRRSEARRVRDPRVDWPQGLAPCLAGGERLGGDVGIREIREWRLTCESAT